MEPEERAKQIADRIFDGQKTLKEFEKQITEGLKVEGRTLREWANELFVQLPKDVDDLDELQSCTSQVAISIQKAEYLLGIFELQANAAGNSSDKRFAIQYVAQMEDQKEKKIAAEKLRQLVLVNEEVDSYVCTAQAASMVRDFFKRIVKGLEETRKSIESQIHLNRLKQWMSGSSQS